MKRVAIVQSNYIPWKGYFDLINMVDEFILFDDMQYTRRDWRNRNKIKTRRGLEWLTIPVQTKGNYHQKIKDIEISNQSWNINHWKTMTINYANTPYFQLYSDRFENLYLGCHEKYLSYINYRFITEICSILSIDTELSWSMDYALIEGKTERLVDLCKQAGATVYLSGPSAQGYIDEALFTQAGITLEYIDYSGYAEYSQKFPPFEHGVTVIDLIFNEGNQASQYLKSF